MTNLLIARHGNTFKPGEPPRRAGRRTDIPLTDEGREQARALGRYLRDNGLLPDAIFCGHLKRTRETALIAMTESGLILHIQEEDIFNEIDYGPDENKTEEDVLQRIGKKALGAWDEDAVVPPGWLADPDKLTQNWLEFGARIARDYAGCTILVVTSNGIARFAPHLTGDFGGFRKQHKLKINTGALCRLECRDDRWTITDWNLKPDPI